MSFSIVNFGFQVHEIFFDRIDDVAHAEKFYLVIFTE